VSGGVNPAGFQLRIGETGQQASVGLSQHRGLLVPRGRGRRIVQLERQLGDLRGMRRLIVIVIHQGGVLLQGLPRILEVAKPQRHRRQLRQDGRIGGELLSGQLERALRFVVLPVQRQR